ncbi:hypothetical protein B0T16DRAFT_454878 [Cercophora newfieldiana]|uniref:Uncharacterized protein n=1 Tax=Cercophora newfieldiana TaxID=92897 RepID=A0AA39YH42_9PEZI|nr:hypothetical protein B0T16DRAFT_454878 [Cercophora newfieldiana]
MFSHGVSIFLGLAILALQFTSITGTPVNGVQATHWAMVNSTSSATVNSTSSTILQLTSTITSYPANFTTFPSNSSRIPTPPASTTSGSLLPQPTTHLTNSTINDDLHCGIFDTANTYDADGILQWLDDKGGDCVTEAKTCTRHACYDTSAVYVCNDNNYAISQKCADVADFGRAIIGNCCNTRSTSGQHFSDSQGFNIVVGYGNCNHGESADRPGLTSSGGPNGLCVTDGNRR